MNTAYYIIRPIHRSLSMTVELHMLASLLYFADHVCSEILFGGIVLTWQCYR